MRDNIINPEGMITVAEAARRLGRSIEQVRRYLREGKLKGVRIGGQWFIEEASLTPPPYRYPPPGRRPSYRLGEAAAVMETPKMTKEELRALMRRIEERRKALRERLGGALDLNVVETLRELRDER